MAAGYRGNANFYPTIILDSKSDHAIPFRIHYWCLVWQNERKTKNFRTLIFAGAALPKGAREPVVTLLRVKQSALTANKKKESAQLPTTNGRRNTALNIFMIEVKYGGEMLSTEKRELNKYLDLLPPHVHKGRPPLSSDYRKGCIRCWYLQYDNVMMLSKLRRKFWKERWAGALR